MRSSLAALLLVGAVACNEPTYLPGHKRLETTPSMTGQGFDPDTDQFTLPIRKPSTDERTALQDETKQLKLPHGVPWVSIDDLPVEIELTITNLGDTNARAFLTVVGCSGVTSVAQDTMGTGGSTGGSFPACYDPGAFVDPNAAAEEQVTPPPLLGNHPIDLAPREIKDLVFREDDLAEAALDLEAIERYPDSNAQATPFEVLAVRSDIWRPKLQLIPTADVIPQVLRFNLTLTADGHVAAHYTVRVRDQNGKLAPLGTTSGLFL